MSLDAAEAAARTAGFHTVSSRDLLRSRIQMAESNWQVCTQSPAPGAADPNAAIMVGVIRIEEVCPGADTGLPDLVGRTLPDAQDATRTAGFSSFTSHDAMGDRSQLDDHNWTVCSQVPAAGATDRTLIVDVAIVKTTEVCPGAAPTTTSTTTAAPRPAPKPAPRPNPQDGEEERTDAAPRRTPEPEPDPDPP